MGNILRVNMSEDRCTTGELPQELIGFGGRGMTSSIVAGEVPPKCDPLGPDNKLVFAPGILSGTACPNSGRLSVGGKSPLTGGIKESNVGGNGASKIARVGLDALIVEGQPEPEKLFLLILKKDSAELVPADDLKDMGTYDLTKTLKEKYGTKSSIICIGPAGEQLLSSASIQVTDLDGNPCRAAGRGGLGALMGSKGLKAIIVDDTGCDSPPLSDKELFRSGQKKVADALREHPVTGGAMASLGTSMILGPINAAGAFPALNARVGTYEKWEQISGEALSKLITSREGTIGHVGCTNCLIRCSNVFLDMNKKYVTSALEYETIWAFGGMCDIPDLDTIAKFDYLCDDLGLDTMNTGCAVAVAMEAGVKEFGDMAGALELVEEVRKGSEIGKLIGNGPSAVGDKYGVTRVPVVKKQSVAAYDPRAMQGMGVTYATCPMGADHTAGWTVSAHLEGKVPALSPDGQIACSQEAQIYTAAADCTGMCEFAGFALGEIPGAAEGQMEMLTGKLGAEAVLKDFTELGKRILRTEREFNTAAGMTSADDRLPEFYYKEPLPPHNTTFLVTDEDIDSFFDF